MNPALILNCNNIMALPLIRLLGKKRIPIIAVFGKGKNISPFHNIVSKSKYISEKIYFDENNYSESLVNALVKFGEKQKIKPVLFLASDTDLEVISLHREKIQQFYHFTLPPDTIIKNLLYKDKFIDLANSYKLPIPKSFKINGIKPDNEIFSQLNFPFLIKPTWRNNNWLNKFKAEKVFIINNPDDLKSALLKMKDFPIEYLIQEIVEGPESNIFCSFTILDKNSEPIASGFCRKITQYPPNYGNTSIAIPIVKKELEELSNHIFRKLKLTGYASIEFRFDENDKQFKIIEITPNRFNRQIAVTSLQGLNLPYILYQSELEKEIKLNQIKYSNKLWLSEVNEIRRIFKNRQNKLKSLIRLSIILPKVRIFEIFDLFDPFPFFSLLNSPLRNFLKNLSKNFSCIFDRNKMRLINFFQLKK